MDVWRGTMRLGLAAVLVTAVLVCGYCVLMALANWFDVTRRSRRLADELPVTHNDARHFDELLWMTVLMNMTAVVAGALAGVGGALAVKDGVVRWPTGNGMQYFYIGVFGVEIVGLLGILRLRRPWHRWIGDAGALHEFLRQGEFRPDLRPEELAHAGKRLRELTDEQFRGRRYRLLRALGLHRPRAVREWRTPTGSFEQVEALRRSFSRLDVLKYACLTGYSGAYLAAAILASLCLACWALIADSGSWSQLLGALKLIGLIAGGWLITLLPARDGLTLETRLIARERVLLAACRRRIAALAIGHNKKPSSRRTVLQVGSWALVRRN
jgi:hypothetical protein